LYQRSLQEAAKIKALAEADAEREARIGIARALAIEEQVRAYGGPQFQVLQQVMDRFSSAIEKSGVDIVPKFVVSGGNGDKGGGGYSAFEALITMLLSEKILPETTPNAPGSGIRDEGEVKRIRDSILTQIATRTAPGEAALGDSRVIPPNQP